MKKIKSSVSFKRLMKLTKLVRLVKEKKREYKLLPSQMKKGSYYGFYNIKNILRYILNNSNQI